MSQSDEGGTNQTLTSEMKEKIEQNRLKALEKRNKKLVQHPYAKSDTVTPNQHMLNVAGKKVIDSGGGFLIEEDDPAAELNELLAQEFCNELPPIVPFERPTCNECKETFEDSYLFQTFNYPACDKCRDNEDKHALITKTDAIKEYLLKDCDLEKRDPPLKFIVRKNPHNVRWGEMKLYLQVQVEERALQVWGSEQRIQEELEKQEEKRHVTKAKKYQKQMKQLRMNVRSSLYDRTSAASSHTHVFGEAKYNEESDDYSHTCTTCGFQEEYEVM